MPTATADRKLTAKDFQVPFPNDWCPGCGDFGILNAIQQAFAKLELEAHKVADDGNVSGFHLDRTRLFIQCKESC